VAVFHWLRTCLGRVRNEIDPPAGFESCNNCIRELVSYLSATPAIVDPKGDLLSGHTKIRNTESGAVFQFNVHITTGLVRSPSKG
jgi:hypothetical protein